MQLDLTLYFNPIPTQIVRVIAYKAKAPTVEITRLEFTPPHLNPRPVTVPVPTPEVYLVKIFETPDSVSVGVLKSEYVATPSLAASRIIPDLDLLVGGTAEQDPVAGTTFKEIPDIKDYNIQRLVKIGYGPLPETAWRQLADGGIELLGEDDDGNPIVFVEGEQYSIQFEPYLDSNVNASVYDLTELITDHIDDLNNPHQTTKAQVGLSNIPNAISDSYQLNSSSTLATSKAVYDLANSITSKIIGEGSYNYGVMPGNSDRKVTITHGYTVSGNYMVIGTLRGYGTDWNADNDTFAVVRNLLSTTFDLTLRNISSASARLYYDYILVKLP